jgi:glycosyltransferase involved in cell wall biosynthesis
MVILSVVVPVYNEEDNIEPLISAVQSAISGYDYELIFVDDGSSDQTVNKILLFKSPNIRLLKMARNFGQTSAMAAGIEAAEGEFIVTMDGDLQNDPNDIPRMMEKLKSEKLDMIAGRRAKRKDGFILRKIPSKIANLLIRKISKVEVRDYGCTLKLFRSNVAKHLDLYGELHRFIPILADINGAKIAEMDVAHHPRRFGVSKYGLGRTLKVASDLMLMAFFLRYRQKPMHLFGGLGLVSGGLGTIIMTYLFILKILGESIGGRPLFFVGILLIVAAFQLITTGFIAELLMRTYFGSQNKQPYRIAFKTRGGVEE